METLTSLFTALSHADPFTWLAAIVLAFIWLLYALGTRVLEIIERAISSRRRP